jgi:2-amino-4-hydroxy-6-hydroxymethyldihydropteridine diphosphokinase
MQMLIGFGANLGDPSTVFEKAIGEIGARDTVLRASSLYRTRAVGPSQPDYLNMTIEIELKSNPFELLDFCHELEIRTGRDRKREERWGPRPLDLDLLLAKELVIRSSRLQLPHPRFHKRVFALAPAAEIAADWRHPFLGKSIADLAADAQANDPDAILETLPFKGSGI